MAHILLLVLAMNLITSICSLSKKLGAPQFDATASAPEDLRVQDRNTVATPALWYDCTGKPRSAVVCDVSAGGAFLRPIGLLPESVDIGTTVRVVFVTRVGSREHKVNATAVVRWLGKSGAHRCLGFGLQFDEPIPTLADGAEAKRSQVQTNPEVALAVG